MQPSRVHVKARCPHLTTHLRTEPCQTTNQAIHHLFTCRPPLRTRRSCTSARQVHVFLGVWKRGLWKRTINKLINRKMSSRVLAHQGQTCTQIWKHMLTELVCNYPRPFTPEAFKGVELQVWRQRGAKKQLQAGRLLFSLCGLLIRHDYVVVVQSFLIAVIDSVKRGPRLVGRAGTAWLQIHINCCTKTSQRAHFLRHEGGEAPCFSFSNISGLLVCYRVCLEHPYWWKKNNTF